MGKYQYFIDRILNLEYKNHENSMQENYDNMLRFEKRIGFGYSINHSIEKEIFTHVEKTCKYKPKCQYCEINKFCEYYRNKLSHKTEMKYKIVDLFCGAGGFSLGFTQEEFNIIFAIDNQPSCIDTYVCNHPEVPINNILCKNIEEALNDMKFILDDEDIDVVIGGPPCQGFSIANRQKMIDDPRNKLYKQFVNSINLLSPKFFVMENVGGILKIENQIKDDFAKLKDRYKTYSVKINAVDFGVPQNRKRVLFIGTRLNIDLNNIVNKINELTCNKDKTVLNDALFGLRNLEANNEKKATKKDSVRSGSIIEINQINRSNYYLNEINRGKISKFIFNHKARYNNNRDIEIFSKLNPGDRSDDPKIADIMPYTNRNDIFKDKYYRLQGDKPCKTITAHMKFDCNMYIHPTQSRGLTPREAARVQSYPDDYIFCGPYTKTYMQIGNSVPPLVSRTIAYIIRTTLDELENKERI